MLKTVCLLLLVIEITHALVCTKGFCDNVKCKDVSCSANQKRSSSGSFCGCCPTCLNVIGKGESCGFLFLRGVPPKATCADGLSCNYKTRKCQ